MMINKRVPIVDGLPVDHSFKGGGGKVGNRFLGAGLAMMTGGISEVLGISNVTGMHDVPDVPDVPNVTSFTGNTVDTDAGATLSESDSTRTIRRKKVSQGTKQFRVPLANKGVGVSASTSGGTGNNIAGGFKI